MIKKMINILIVVLLFVSVTTSSVVAYTDITLEDTKKYLEENIQEEEDFTSISIEGNSLKITGENGLTLNLFYDSENNTFYSEETFDNTMSSETVAIKIGRNRHNAFFWILCCITKKWSTK